MWNKSDKSKRPHLDTLDSGFAVVPFDVHIYLRVANKAEWRKQTDKYL